jgi:type IV pilus biogenesis protein CpaD/CtpE
MPSAIRRRAVALLFAAGAALAGCANEPQRAPAELLDEQTGATLVVVTEPLVLARARLDVAANARDYLTVVAVEANRSGNYTQYLLVHRWSTVDRRMAELPAESAGRLIIEADGRTLELKPLQPMPAALVRRDRVHLPADADVVSWAYDVDLATLAYIAGSQQIRARLPDEPLDSPFTLWADGSAALRAFATR